MPFTGRPAERVLHYPWVVQGHKAVQQKISQVALPHRYIPELQGNILQKRLTADGGVPLVKKTRPGDPRLLGLLTDVIAPSTEELLMQSTAEE